MNDTALAERCLNHIGFQRLSSYWRPFESKTTGQQGNLFNNGTVFGAVMARYLFDQRLRSHMLEAFSFIEVSVRTQWAHQLAYEYGHGEHAHQNGALFNEYHTDNMKELERTYQQISNQENSSFQQLALWDVIHAMSFGQLSKWYSSTRDRKIRRSIAQQYGMDESVLRSALRHLTKVRNICAHHERLWDLNISAGLKIPNNLGKSLETGKAFNPQGQDKVYNAIVMTAHLMEAITPNGDWTERFLDLTKSDTNKSIPEARMGFPNDWEEHALWIRHLPVNS